VDHAQSAAWRGAAAQPWLAFRLQTDYQADSHGKNDARTQPDSCIEASITLTFVAAIPRASGGSDERFVGMGDKCSALCFSVTLFGFVFVSAYGPCVDPPSPPPKAGRTPAQILHRPTPDIFQQLAMSLNPTEKCEMLLETELSIFQTPTHSPPSSSEDRLQFHCLSFLDLYRPKSICQIPHGPALHCGFLRLPSP
jgi:hypothetical protein